MVRVNRKNEIKTKKQRGEIIALVVFLVAAAVAALVVAFGIKDADNKTIKKCT